MKKTLLILAIAFGCFASAPAEAHHRAGASAHHSPAKAHKHASKNRHARAHRHTRNVRVVYDSHVSVSIGWVWTPGFWIGVNWTPGYWEHPSHGRVTHHARDHRHPRRVWVPAHYEGRGRNRHYVPGHYEWRGR